MPIFRRRAAVGGATPSDREGAEHAGRREEADWRSFDAVADEYARVWGPRLVEPARDLVGLLKIHRGARLLDVGTGTGIVARAAAGASGADGSVVGVDPSLPMLAIAAREAGGPRYAAALGIDLPFRGATFDAVISSFVLSHVPSYQTALFDWMRVLRPGGRMGVTNWSADDDRDDLSKTWRAAAEEFAEHELLEASWEEAVPWEARFSDPTRLKEALHDAGLRDLWTERRSYRFAMTAEEYITGREVSSIGRFLRQTLGEEFWPAFQRRAREVFAERFPPSFHDFREAIFAVGHKP